MIDLGGLKTELQSYYGPPEVNSRRDGRRHPKLTQKFLEWDMYMAETMLSKKLSGKDKNVHLTGDDLREIGSALIRLKRITRRSQLLRLFSYYPSLEVDWQQEPWKGLLDDTPSPRDAAPLLIQNASFEAWEGNTPLMWECNTKTGRVRPVPGRDAKKGRFWELEPKGSSALEICGNPDNQAWVYCRTRETQDLSVVPGSKIGLSFWARKTQEGKAPGRAKYVEVFYYDGSQWLWGFSQEVTHDGDWQQYITEWWEVPATGQKASVGVVVYKDGAFQVDDIELRVKKDK